jgi:hypothetical protein
MRHQLCWSLPVGASGFTHLTLSVGRDNSNNSTTELFLLTFDLNLLIKRLLSYSCSVGSLGESPAGSLQTGSDTRTES